jgi:glutathione peroxidase-family protein
MKTTVLVSLAVLLLASHTPRSAAAEGTADAQTATVGGPAPDFTITDSDGKEQKLSSYAGKIVVLEWTNYDCPFVKKQYKTKNMQSLQKAYTKKGVVWLSVMSSAKGKQGYYEADAVNEKRKERGANPTAILLDRQGTVGQLYEAKTTPDMYVIDNKGVLAYEGAIDDASGVDEIPGKRNYVREALDAVLAGKPVKTTYTKSYGCGVKYQ